MFTRIRVLATAAAILVMTSVTASAGTVTDPTLYSDLASDTSHDLAGFAIVGPVSGPATLFVRAGIWNSSSGVAFETSFTFNGTLLAPPLAVVGAYFTDSVSTSYDVSSFVISGMNTLSVFSTATTGSGTYAVGDLSLEFVGAAVPLPATAWLMITGLGALGVRKRMA